MFGKKNVQNTQNLTASKKDKQEEWKEKKHSIHLAFIHSIVCEML